MYYYVYDSFLVEKKYQKIIAQIETRLMDLGMSGRINRLSPLKNIDPVIKEEVERGLKTIVAVGNDRTFNKIVNLAADIGVTVGFIPLGGGQKIADIFGIPEGVEACNILSARIIERVNLGLINGCYFLTSLAMEAKNIFLECDNNYLVNLENKNIITVANRNIYQKNGYLEITMETTPKNFWEFWKTGDCSRLKGKKILINSHKSQPILVNDEKKIIKTPAKIKIVPQKISIITGKNRKPH